MEYTGKLYGKIGNKYFDTGRTSDEFDYYEAKQNAITCNLQSVIKSLPEYNEILYHAKTLTNEQFREYWDEVQGNVL